MDISINSFYVGEYVRQFDEKVRRARFGDVGQVGGRDIRERGLNAHVFVDRAVLGENVTL